MSDGSFNLTVEWTTPRSIVIALAGEVDSPEASQMEREISSAVDRGARKVLVDLSQIEFLGSAGLNALVVCRNRLKEVNGVIELRNPNRIVQKLLAISGLEAVFPQVH